MELSSIAREKGRLRSSYNRFWRSLKIFLFGMDHRISFFSNSMGMDSGATAHCAGRNVTYFNCAVLNTYLLKCNDFCNFFLKLYARLLAF